MKQCKLTQLTKDNIRKEVDHVNRFPVDHLDEILNYSYIEDLDTDEPDVVIWLQGKVGVRFIYSADIDCLDESPGDDKIDAAQQNKKDSAEFYEHIIDLCMVADDLEYISNTLRESGSSSSRIRKTCFGITLQIAKLSRAITRLVISDQIKKEVSFKKTLIRLKE